MTAASSRRRRSRPDGVVVAETVRATLRARLTRMLVIIAVVAGVVVVSLGTGYRASRALLDDGSAYLVKGRTVTHANAETRRSDAEVARDVARGGERLAVHQTPEGQVLIIDTATGVVSRLDQATMTTRPVHRGTAGRIEVLGSGRDTYYLDTGRGTVEQADAQDATVRRPVHLPAAATAAVADPKGALWVLDRSGTLSRVENGTVVDTVDVGSGHQQVTAVGGRPVLVDDSGAVRVVDDGVVRTLDSGLTSGGDYQVPQAGAGRTVWVIDRRAGSLVGVDLGSGRTSNVDLGADEGARFGPSLTHAGKVYVPDFSAHVVRVVSADGRLERTIAVPGTSATFDLFVDGGRVWMNDPSARSARVLDTGGETRRVDKGPGHGVSDPGEEHVPVPPVGPVAPPVTVGEPATAPSGGASGPATGPAAGAATGPGHDGGTRRDPGNQDGGAKPTPDPTGRPGSPPAPTPTPTDPGPGGGSTPATIAVPDTVGTSRTAACAALRTAGLDCSEQGTGSQRGVPPDQVVASSPAAGTQVAAGTIVTVQYAGAITVPDLAGRTPQEACDQLLTPAGLTCDGQAAGAATSGQPVGVVTQQSPAPGQQVGGGSTVTYQYFDQFHVDNFVGLSPAAACQALASRPITCKTVDKGNGPRGSTQNVVVDQSLPPGDYPAGRSIDLGFYSGVNGDPVPNVVGLPVGAGCQRMAQAGYTDCSESESPTPQRNTGAVAQSEAPGTVVGSKKHIDVVVESQQAYEVCRYRRSNTADVWILRIGCDTSGITDWVERASLGWAYIDNEQAQPGTQQLFDNMCNCGVNRPADGLNHMITVGGFNASPWLNNGTVGRLFTQDFGGMHQIVRYHRNDADGTSDYAYGIPGDPNNFYPSQGFQSEGPIGYAWN